MAALRFETAAYSWAKAIEVTQWLGEGVAIDNSFRVELREFIYPHRFVARAGRSRIRNQSRRWLVGSLDRKQYSSRCLQEYGFSFFRGRECRRVQLRR